MRQATAGQAARRTMGAPSGSQHQQKPSSSTTAPAPTTSSSSRPRTTATTRRTTTSTAPKSASPKPRTSSSAQRGAPPTTTTTTTSSNAPKSRSVGRPSAATPSSKTPTSASRRPMSPQKSASKGKTPLGSLFGGSSPARSRLEQLAEQDDQHHVGGHKHRDGDGHDDDDHGDKRDSSVGRHADLDDMSPENASFKELVELREKQHTRVKDVLLRYNEDLQKRLDTSSAVGSLSRHHHDGSERDSQSPVRTRGMTVGPVSTADEAKIIEDLLNGKEVGETDDGRADDGEAAAVAATATATTTASADAGVPRENEGASSPQPSKGPDTPRVGGVSRAALRAIIKHAQDTVNKAIVDDRERQADFEEAVLSRMQAMERLLSTLQVTVKDQAEARAAAAEGSDKSVRTSEFAPFREKLEEIERRHAAKASSDKEQLDVIQSQIEFVASDLQNLAKGIKEHKQNLDETTKDAAEQATKKAIDDASDRVRELCEAVERGLALTERCRDDIPQAIITSVENVEASLHRAMQSEFDAQSLRLQVAEEHQAEVNRTTKETLEHEVSGIKTAVGEALGDLRRNYGDAVQEHIDEVRKKAEEYEEARKLALPVPDSDRVKLMQEELESSLQMLKYLTEASSNAMTSTIPPRLERSEQKTAQLEAALESQQEEIDRLRHSNLRFDVAVGPDNLKDAWLGVSSYRSCPPPAAEAEGDGEGEEREQRFDKIIGFDETGQPIQAYSPETMHQVHNQISEALRMIARRHASMSPLRGSPRSAATQRAQQNEPVTSTGRGLLGHGADAGAASTSSASSSPHVSSRQQSQNQNQLQQQPLFSSGCADALPKDFDSRSPREQLESINQVASAKRAQLVHIQKVLSNIQQAFHELTMQEAEIMAQSSPSRLAPTGGTPRTVAEYQSNRRICDEIAARKQRMYEKERLIVEKRNKLSREIEALHDRENEVFKALSASARSK